MKKNFKFLLALFISSSLILSGCNKVKNEDSPSIPASNATVTQASGNVKSTEPPATATPSVDPATVKANEAGKIMIVMFHNFVESFTPTKYDDGAYTTTFGEFEKLLQELYDKGYRLISMNDYLNNNISVPAGCMPMVFTFDDGTSGQFNLVKEGDKLVANKKSAVGIMEEFNKTHPDFGLKATFYVNLGSDTFKGEGTDAEKLKYLVDEGLEIGNHTYTHVHLNEIKDANKIQEEIGKNQKRMYELIPDYKMNTFSLPFGQPSKSLKDYVAKGEFEGVKYDNLAIVEVGWDPWYSPVNKKFDPLTTHRVRASGIKPVDADLAWWLKNLSHSELYVSDGNPGTVSVPKEKEEAIDKNKLGDKKLVVY